MVTMGRNSIGFATFMVYIDLAKQAYQAGWIPALLMTTDQPVQFDALCQGSNLWKHCLVDGVAHGCGQNTTAEWQL